MARLVLERRCFDPCFLSSVFSANGRTEVFESAYERANRARLRDRSGAGKSSNSSKKFARSLVLLSVDSTPQQVSILFPDDRISETNRAIPEPRCSTLDNPLSSLAKSPSSLCLHRRRFSIVCSRFARRDGFARWYGIEPGTPDSRTSWEINSRRTRSFPRRRERVEVLDDK